MPLCPPKISKLAGVGSNTDLRSDRPANNNPKYVTVFVHHKYRRFFSTSRFSSHPHSDDIESHWEKTNPLKLWGNTWCVQVLRSPKEAFAAAMQSWRERCEKCVRLQGDYVEK